MERPRERTGTISSGQSRLNNLSELLFFSTLLISNRIYVRFIGVARLDEPLRIFLPPHPRLISLWEMADVRHRWNNRYHRAAAGIRIAVASHDRPDDTSRPGWQRLPCRTGGRPRPSAPRHHRSLGGAPAAL